MNIFMAVWPHDRLHKYILVWTCDLPFARVGSLPQPSSIPRQGKRKGEGGRKGLPLPRVPQAEAPRHGLGLGYTAKGPTACVDDKQAMALIFPSLKPCSVSTMAQAQERRQSLGTFDHASRGHAQGWDSLSPTQLAMPKRASA